MTTETAPHDLADIERSGAWHTWVCTCGTRASTAVTSTAKATASQKAHATAAAKRQANAAGK